MVALVAQQDARLGSANSALIKTLSAPGKAPASTVEGELVAGEMVGRYVVSHRIGAGGMGVVYAARDPDLARPVALKLLRWQSIDSDARQAGEARLRLLREAQTLARLSHPNVVAVYDVGTYGEQVFLAMEYVDGSTLAEWLRAGHSVAECLETFHQAGLGLAAAHSAGLVHRDFKPSNVMVSADGRVRVTDFGLARAISTEEEHQARQEAALHSIDAFNHTHTGMVLGTPAYMAPEQLLGGTVDHRADQFSFCVSLYEALYGERPFNGQSLAQLKAALQAEDLRDQPAGTKVPRWVRRVLLRGLKPNAEHRYASMQALLLALKSKPPTTNRWALLLALSIVAVVAATWRQPEHAAPSPSPVPATPQAAASKEAAPEPLVPPHDVMPALKQSVVKTKPTASGPGLLAAHVAPWGTLTVDGRSAESANSMDYVVTLSSGRHQVVATHPQFGRKTAVLIIEAGKALHWNVDLR